MSVFTISLIGLVAFPAGADSRLEGRVLSSSGDPAAGAQVLLFDLTDLRAAPLAATTDRSGRFTLPLSGAALPQGFELGSNYPNPFNPSTIIPYQLPASMHVRLEVFNLLGQRIATLVDGERGAGAHTAEWDATDAAGQAVGAGVYLYRLSGEGAKITRRMLLIDGQAGIAGGRAGSSGVTSGAAGGEEAGEAPVYGLTVSVPGLVPYVDPALRVEAGLAPVEVVLEAPGPASSAKAASSGGVLGDVDNTGGVDFFDALLVALYSQDSRIVMPNNGVISLGDVNADGRVDLADAWLIAAWLNDPSDPSLPAGIGQAVGPAASLSPDPATVTFADDGAWHRFTVEAREQVSVVVNPGADTPRLEISHGRGSNYCPAEADDDVSRRDGQSVYLAGCAEGPATVELRRRSDGSVLQTYTFEVMGSPADLIVESVAVSDSTLTPGQSFTLRATVRNQGTGAAAATTLRWYRSSNRTISTRNAEVGTDPVRALAASRTSAESIRLTAPSSEGTYYYGACVDNVRGERAGNNCSGGLRAIVEQGRPEPPFAGTVWIDPDIITPSDPTAFQDVTAAGRGERSMYDRRVDGWITVNAYLFDARFDDGLAAEIQVNPEFGSVSAAMEEANEYGRAIGQLPNVLRTNVETVWIHKGDYQCGGGSKSILIHVGKMSGTRKAYLEELLVHESAHTSLDPDWMGIVDAVDWRAAQMADGNFISDYARDQPEREDIAESFLPYLAVRYRTARISPSYEQTVLETMPNRIAYFDRLLQVSSSNAMHPVTEDLRLPQTSTDVDADEPLPR